MSFDEDPRENECPYCCEYEKERKYQKEIIKDRQKQLEDKDEIIKKYKELYLRLQSFLVCIQYIQETLQQVNFMNLTMSQSDKYWRNNVR